MGPRSIESSDGDLNMSQSQPSDARQMGPPGHCRHSLAWNSREAKPEEGAPADGPATGFYQCWRKCSSVDGRFITEINAFGCAVHQEIGMGTQH